MIEHLSFDHASKTHPRFRCSETDRGETEVEPFYAKMSDEQFHGYWERKNQTSIDGLPTNIVGDASPG